MLTSFVYKHISVNILVKDAKLYLIETNKDSEREREREIKKTTYEAKIVGWKNIYKNKTLKYTQTKTNL